ncbi:MAG: DUF2269 domain-containing protein [Micromonosporaceae bacterium]|nr:DUF2269 domain-containing protein [Micromonosporaceae bacterium]
MPPRVRKGALTLHVAFSVGWIGAAGGYVAIALAGLTSRDAEVVRAAYLTMELIAWQVLVPLSLGSLVSGLVSSLGTTWGLFRHYWVLFKLLLNLVATAVLLGYAQSIGHIADVAAQPTWSSADLDVLRNSTHVIHSTGGLLVLLTALVLAVYKPRGTTPYGQRGAP